MGTTFRMSATDLYDATAPWDCQRTEFANLHVCRAGNCGGIAHRGDEFCARCRDEIDALRQMPPWRPKRPRKWPRAQLSQKLHACVARMRVPGSGVFLGTRR